MNTISLLLGAVALSIIHAMIPNHWLPFIVIGKAERWSRQETLKITAISGLSHTASTILVGIAVGVIGYKLSSVAGIFTHMVAPLVMVIIGILYVLRREYPAGKPHHHHGEAHHHIRHHSHGERHLEGNSTGDRSGGAMITSLVAAMFFSPCLEIEAYYFTAGTALGWVGIASVSVIYMILTVGGMVLLVDLGRRGGERIKFSFMENHENLITGAILVATGIVTLLAS